GEDHLSGCRRRCRRTVAEEVDAGGAPPVEAQALGLGMGQDGEVGPAPGGPEEGLGGAPADAGLLVDLEIAAAFVVAAVEGIGRRDSGLGAGGAEGVEDLPADARRLDPPFAAGAVDVAVAEIV